MYLNGLHLWNSVQSDAMLEGLCAEKLLTVFFSQLEDVHVRLEQMDSVSLRSLMDSITSGRIVDSYPSTDAEESKTFSLAFLTEPIIILTIVVPGGGVGVLHSTEAGNSSSRNLERHGRVVTEVDLPPLSWRLVRIISKPEWQQRLEQEEAIGGAEKHGGIGKVENP